MHQLCRERNVTEFDFWNDSV